MADCIMVTGGSGFVGGAVIEELSRRGYEVAALVHRRPVGTATHVRLVKGGLFDGDAVRRAMEGCSAVIHLVGIIREDPHHGITFKRMHAEGTRVVVEAAAATGVRRFVHMSALGTRAKAPSRYHESKHAAESLVRRKEELQWTIFRPSMIHGAGGEFMQMVAAWARRRKAPYLFMPYFGTGALGTGATGRIQPVYVGDVARAFVDALEKPTTSGKTYEIGGPEAMSWPEFMRRSAKLITGRERRAAGIPVWYAKLLTRITPSRLLPFNREQVLMSQEKNTCDLKPFIDDFGWTPRGFDETLAEYAAKL